MRVAAVWIACMACSFDRGTAGTAPRDGAGGGDGAGDSAGCPGDYPLSFGGHVYKLIGQTDWDSSQAMCVADQGHLAKITDMATNDYLKQQIGTGFAWIGLKDLNNNDMLFWTDGTALTGYQNFSGSIASLSKNCVDMGATAGTWAVYTCGNPEPAFCECP